MVSEAKTVLKQGSETSVNNASPASPQKGSVHSCRLSAIVHSSFHGDEPRFHLDGTHIPFVVVVVSTRWFQPPVLSDSFPISGEDLDAHAPHDQEGEGLGTLSTKLLIY